MHVFGWPFLVSSMLIVSAAAIQRAQLRRSARRRSEAHWQARNAAIERRR